MMGSVTTLSANKVWYYPVGNFVAGSTSEAIRSVAMARSYSFSTLTLSVSTPGGVTAGGAAVFTVRKNGAATGLTITIPIGTDGTTAPAELSVSAAATFAAGDVMSIEFDNTGGATNISAFAWSVA